MENNIVWEVVYFNRTIDYESINTYVFKIRKDNEYFELNTNMDDKIAIEWYWIYEDITDYVYKAQIELREKEVV